MTALPRLCLVAAALLLAPGASVYAADNACTIDAVKKLGARARGVAVIDKDTFFSGYRAINGVIQTGPVSIGKDVFVGEKAVLDIGRSLDLVVIAEGIETPEQEAALMGMGCRYAQGYRYGRPVPGDLLGLRLAEPVPAKTLSRSA